MFSSFMDIDFSDADIVFTYDLLFTAELKEGVARTARRLQPGSRVISSRGLPGPGFSSPKLFYCGDSRRQLAPQEFSIQIVTGQMENEAVEEEEEEEEEGERQN